MSLLDQAAGKGFNPEFIVANRGVAYRFLGMALEEAGKDPLDSYLNASRDLDYALPRSWQPNSAWTVLPGLCAQIASAMINSRKDPGPFIEKGMRCADECVRNEPGKAVHWQERGELHRLAGRIELAAKRDPSARFMAAASDLNEAIRLDPGMKYALLGRGSLYSDWSVSRGNTILEKRSLLDRAAADFRAGMADKPAPEDLVCRGVMLRRRADTEREAGTDSRTWLVSAVADLDAAYAGKPSPGILAELGIARLELGLAEEAVTGAGEELTDKAESEFRAVLKQDPESDAAMSQLSYVLELRGQVAEAAVIYEKIAGMGGQGAADGVRRMKNAMASPQWMRDFMAAEMRLRRGHYPRARAHYEAALKGLGPAPADPRARSIFEATHFNLSCILAVFSSGRRFGPRSEPEEMTNAERDGFRVKAVEHLKACLDANPSLAQNVQGDDDLAHLKGFEPFEKMLREKRR